MTVLNHAQSAEAAVVVVAADTSGRNARRSFARRLRISSLATLLVTTGVSGLSTTADARGMTGGGGSTEPSGSGASVPTRP